MALYLLTYRRGFVKRGLVGELLSPIPHFSRAGLVAIQLGFIVAAFALTYIVLRRLVFGSAGDRALAAVLLAGPALLPHVGILFAQPDVTLYILLLGALWGFLALPPTPAAFLSSVLCSIALLVHEGFSLSFYPFVVAILFDLVRRRRLGWRVAVLQIAAVFTVFVLVFHFGRLKVSPDLILADAVERTSVPLQRQVYDVLASSYAQQRALVRHFYAYPDMQRLFALTAVLSIPYFALLFNRLRLAAHARGDTSVDRLLRIVLFALPLVLCLFGHDVGRWLADCAIDATLFLCYLALTDSNARASLRAWARGPRPFVWLAWFLITGPFTASALGIAERLRVLWDGP